MLKQSLRHCRRLFLEFFIKYDIISLVKEMFFTEVFYEKFFTCFVGIDTGSGYGGL